jgi:hypothetical protein
LDWIGDKAVEELSEAMMILKLQQIDKIQKK